MGIIGVSGHNSPRIVIAWDSENVPERLIIHDVMGKI
jgi:hypothetical protein